MGSASAINKSEIQLIVFMAIMLHKVISGREAYTPFLGPGRIWPSQFPIDGRPRQIQSQETSSRLLAISSNGHYRHLLHTLWGKLPIL